MKKRIAVIILNYNGFDDTRECIESVLVNKADLEIFLIDNASPDKSGERLHAAYPEIQYYQTGENAGYAKGNNYGITKALEQGFEYCLILNNDVVVEPGFYKPMLNIIDKDKTIGAVTCKVLYKHRPDMINAAGGHFSKLLCTGVNTGIGQRDEGKSETRDIEFIPGMIILISREAIQKVGLMKEHFFLYFEDLEYSFRIGREFRMVYTSAAKIYHKSGGGMRGSDYTSTYLFYHTRNRIWLFREKGGIYYLYVLLYSLINCAAKTVIILINNKTFTETSIVSKKLKNLWNGYFAGIFES